MIVKRDERMAVNEEAEEVVDLASEVLEVGSLLSLDAARTALEEVTVRHSTVDL